MPFFINSGSGTSTATGTTIAASAINAGTGNLIVALVGIGATGSPTVTQVTDTATNAYVQCAGALVNGTGVSCDIWYAKNTKANASNIVTATISVTHLARGIIVLQYGGCDPTNPFDVAAHGNVASGTSVTSSSYTPKCEGNLCVSYIVPNALSTTTPDFNFHKRVNLDSDTSLNCSAADRFSSPLIAQTAAWASSATTELSMTVASFRSLQLVSGDTVGTPRWG